MKITNAKITPKRHRKKKTPMYRNSDKIKAPFFADKFFLSFFMNIQSLISPMIHISIFFRFSSILFLGLFGSFFVWFEITQIMDIHIHGRWITITNHFDQILKFIQPNKIKFDTLSVMNKFIVSSSLHKSSPLYIMSTTLRQLSDPIGCTFSNESHNLRNFSIPSLTMCLQL